MLRGMSEMPVGAIGFDAVGEVEDDDWERAVEKARGFSVRDLASARAWLATQTDRRGRARACVSHGVRVER